MQGYIDISNIRYHEKENIDGYVYSEYVYRNEIEALAIENVKPIISTRFLFIDKHRDIDGNIYETYKCDNCGEVFSSYYSGKEFNFCSKCGARIIR